MLSSSRTNDAKMLPLQAAIYNAGMISLELDTLSSMPIFCCGNRGSFYYRLDLASKLSGKISPFHFSATYIPNRKYNAGVSVLSDLSSRLSSLFLWRHLSVDPSPSLPASVATVQ